MIFIKKPIKALIISLVSILLVAAITLSVFAIGSSTDPFLRYTPPREDMLNNEQLFSLLLFDDEISEENADKIYRQTGLTKEGLMRAIEADGISGIAEYRDNFFGSYNIREDNFAPFCSAEYIDKRVKMLPLKDGDIIITASIKFSFWEMGHCAMVIDGKRETILEATGVGKDSATDDAYSLKNRPTFMVLRPTADEETVAAVVDYAKENLLGIKYDPTIGILSPKHKDDIDRTHCSHIIWYAFMQYGIDIDSNGGPVVHPKNIANSEHFELLQIFGFDPDKLWE